MDPVLLAIPLGIAIGLIVGGVGGGGAILAFPVLVYVLGEAVSEATTASLIVVAIGAAVGAGALALRGHVCWRLALAFTLPAGAAALAGTFGSREVGAKALVVSFVPVMIVAAAATWRRAGQTESDRTGPCPPIDRRQVVLAGLGVGFLTGFFGVGGGFLIVPVLTVWMGLGFRRAVATSLVIITLTGSFALAAHLAVGTQIDAPVTAALAAATAAGALAGTVLSQRLRQAALGRAFALVVAVMAVYLLADVVLFGGPPAG